MTIVEYLDRICTGGRRGLDRATRRYKRAGIKLLTSTRVESIEDGDGPVRVTVTTDGGQQVLEADKVMQAIGFTPRVTGYGLENTGVELTDRGAIQIDDFMRTSVPNIYAIGDVTAKLMLAHVAEAMGSSPPRRWRGRDDGARLRMMPRATFASPGRQLRWTEAQAREQGFDVRSEVPVHANGRLRGGRPGRLRELISDGRYGELIGGHLIGPE